MFNASHNCVVPKWPGHFWNWKCVRFWTCFLWNSLSTVNASVLKLGDTQVLNPTGIKECPLSLWLSHADEDGWISILTCAKHCKHCLTDYIKLPVHTNHAVVPCAQCISYKKYLLVTWPHQTNFFQYSISVRSSCVNCHIKTVYLCFMMDSLYCTWPQRQ